MSYNDWLAAQARMPPRLSAAARLQVIQELLCPPIYDEAGCLVGYGPPLLSPEDVRDLLNEGGV